MAVKDQRIVTQTTAREAIEWVGLLANRLGCAGPPACDRDGEIDGAICLACQAKEWLQKRRLL